jgi:hypothetical protein
MLRAVGPVIAFLMMLVVVACTKRDPVADEANKTAGLPVINEAAPDATGAPPQGGAAPATQAPAPAAKIPAALQGRWGLSPADCMPNRPGAKGLLVISGDQIQFYESRAVPGPDVQSDGDYISGNFNFTGEGQTWTKFQSLQLQKKDLVRTESNPTASFTYAKCT